MTTDNKVLLKEYTTGEFRFGFELEGFLEGLLEGDEYGTPEFDEEAFFEVYEELEGTVYVEDVIPELDDDEVTRAYWDNIDLDESNFKIAKYSHDDMDNLEELEFYWVTDEHKNDFVAEGAEFLGEFEDNLNEYGELSESVQDLVRSGTVVLFSASRSTSYKDGTWSQDKDGWYWSTETQIMCSEDERNMLDERGNVDSDFMEDILQDPDMMGQLSQENGHIIDQGVRDRIGDSGTLYDRVYVTPRVDYEEMQPTDFYQTQELKDSLEDLFDSDEVYKGEPEVTTDSSLEPNNPTDMPFELNSQVLYFKPSTLSKLGNWLYGIQREYDFYVNETCGFHTHLSWPDINRIDMLWILMNLYNDEKTMSYIEGIKNEEGGIRGIDFLNRVYANKRHLYKIESMFSNQDLTPEQRLQYLYDQTDTEKYDFMNIHNQGTLEWRGPRGFIKPNDVEDIVEYLKRLYVLVMKMGQYLKNDELNGIGKREFYIFMYDKIKSTRGDVPAEPDRKWTTTGHKRLSRSRLDRYLTDITKLGLKSTDNPEKMISLYNKMYDIVAKKGLWKFNRAFEKGVMQKGDMSDDAKADFVLNAHNKGSRYLYVTEFLKYIAGLNIDWRKHDKLFNVIMDEFLKSKESNYDVVLNAVNSFMHSDTTTPKQKKKAFDNVMHAVKGWNRYNIEPIDVINSWGKFVGVSPEQAEAPVEDPHRRTNSRIIPPLRENIQPSDLQHKLDELETFYSVHLDEMDDVDDQMMYEFIESVEKNDQETFERLRGNVADIIKEYAESTWEFDLRLSVIPDILEN